MDDDAVGRLLAVDWMQGQGDSRGPGSDLDAFAAFETH